MNKEDKRSWIFLILFFVVLGVLNGLVNKPKPVEVVRNEAVIPLKATEVSKEVVSIVKLHNELRASMGLSTLVIDSRLNESALLKANQMLERDCWSHYCPSAAWKLFGDAGYDYYYAGENLAHGFGKDWDRMVRAWINSPTHYENMVSGNFDNIGVAIVEGEFQGSSSDVVVVVHFGRLK